MTPRLVVENAGARGTVASPRWPGLAALVRLCRAIIGAPDYAGYVTHMRERHPECVPLTEPEFQRERWEARYSRPGSRCC